LRCTATVFFGDGRVFLAAFVGDLFMLGAADFCGDDFSVVMSARNAVNALVICTRRRTSSPSSSAAVVLSASSFGAVGSGSGCSNGAKMRAGLNIVAMAAAAPPSTLNEALNGDSTAVISHELLGRFFATNSSNFNCRLETEGECETVSETETARARHTGTGTDTDTDTCTHAHMHRCTGADAQL
jgi:hypothetical protein